MKWIKLNEYHYAKEDQIRDIQFIQKNDSEAFYRVFYANGQFTETKGFKDLKEAVEYASKIFEFGDKEITKVKNNGNK